MEDSIVNILANDNYIIVNRSLIKELGLKETIILGELASEYNYYKKTNELDEDGYFYSTIENIENNTSLSSYEQKKCLDNLSKRGLIDVILKGIPAKRHIKINTSQIINLFTNGLETSFQKIKKLDCEKLGTNSNNIKNNKNNKKEIYKERFVKPTIEEIEEYCKERNNGIDAVMFYNFYESKDWMIGKNKIKNWKSCIITWERNRKQNVKQDIELPSWYDKEVETQTLSQEEQNEMEKLLEDFK